MDYFEVSISYEPVSEDNNEILMAILGELPYESFTEQNFGIVGYVPSNQFNKQETLDALEPIKAIFSSIQVCEKLIKDQNWNATWEENFPPMNVDKKVRIRAPFHEKDPSFEYEILIEPKMSFGTGHHGTTENMMRLMLDIDFTNKEVLDMGCGTGVLAILASMRKAKNIVAIDIDNWSYVNAIENAERNNISNMKVMEGDAQLIEGKSFDIVLANINRNILLNDMEHYSQTLSKNGLLLLSGFYTEDLEIIKEKTTECGFSYQKHIVKNNWVAALFSKN